MAKDGLKILKDHLASGEFNSVYVFHGEERYLLEYYLDELQKKVVTPGFEDFNLFRYDGSDLDMAQLYEAVEALPMFAERKMLVVTDLDLYKPGGSRKDELDAILAGVPDCVVLVFVYDTIEYKTDARSKIHKILTDKAVIVSFDTQGDRELTGWLRRRFSAMDKTIGHELAERMLFLCGRSMTLLVNEVEKVAAYAASPNIAWSDIEAVCIPCSDAVVFDLTGAVASGKHGRAIELCRELTAMRNDPIYVLAALGKQLRQLLFARIAIETRKGDGWLGGVADIRSSYAVRKTMELAQRFSTAWCREAVRLAAECDYELKRSLSDRSVLLETLLLRLAALK